jgi:HEAT repeat protein
MSFSGRCNGVRMRSACVVWLMAWTMSGASEEKRLDLTDISKARKAFAAMSTDELSKYLTNPKKPEFSWAFGALQDRGEEAIPHFIKLMERDDLGAGWIYPMEALIQIGDKSVPAIVDVLVGKNERGRRNAAWALMKRNKPCEAAIAPLIEILKARDAEAAGYAAAALAPNGKDAKGALADLIPLAFSLKDSASPRMAIEAIGLDPTLIPEVIRYIADGANRVKTDRMLHIETGAELLHGAGKEGVPQIADALANEETSVRLAAILAIQRLGKAATSDAVEAALKTAITNDDNQVEAAAALVAIGASANAAIPGLIQELRSGELVPLASTELRYSCRAVVVLGTIPEAVPALVEALDSDNEKIRIGCLCALSVHAPNATLAIPKIKKLLVASKSAADLEFATITLFCMDPKWVANAVGTGPGAPTLPPKHWRQVVSPVVAAAKADIEMQ